jgi:hypothetical protein
MLRPLVIDLLAALLPVVIGASALVLGWRLCRWRRLYLVGGIVLSVLLSTAVVLLSATALQDHAGMMIHRLGGAVLLSSWPGCFLMGVVWGNPRRTFSRGFCGFLTGLLVVLLLMASSGRLVWRSFGGSMWHNTADKDGCLFQTSGMTCGPASVVMLLHHHGIEATEGEIAYLSNTSLFGNTLYGLTETVDLKVWPEGMQVHVGQLGYEEARALGVPFVAQCTIFGIKGHAIYVEHLDEDHALIVDPLHGHRERMRRQEFESKWNGRSLWVARLR